MSKKISYLITFLIIFVALPIGIYTFYFNYQDGLYPSLVEFDSYTTKDKAYDLKVMKYNSLGGEESYTFKLYLINKETDEITFIKTVKISSYGMSISYSEDTDIINQHKITAFFSASNGKMEAVEIDAINGLLYGKKLKGGIF